MFGMNERVFKCLYASARFYSGTSYTNLVRSLMNLFDCSMDEFHVEVPSAADKNASVKQAAAIWSMGGSDYEKSQKGL